MLAALLERQLCGTVADEVAYWMSASHRTGFLSSHVVRQAGVRLGSKKHLWEASTRIEKAKRDWKSKDAVNSNSINLTRNL